MAEYAIEDRDGYYQISNLDLGTEDYHDIYQKIEDAIKVKKQDVLLSLASVSVLYSSHLAALVRIHQILHKNTLRFVLTDISQEIKNLLQITQLDTIFSVYDTLGDFKLHLKAEMLKHQDVVTFEWQITKNAEDAVTVMCKGNMFAGDQLDELKKSIVEINKITFDFSGLQSADTESVNFLNTIADNHSLSIIGAGKELTGNFSPKLINLCQA